MARCGIRLGDLYHPEYFKARLCESIEAKSRLFDDGAGAGLPSADEIYDQYLGYAERVRPFVTDTVALINNAVRDGKRVLFEGAQGALLDIDFGTYPYTTSSNATCCGISSGIGLAPQHLGDAVGIVKAYTTRVGSGPFPSELSGDLETHLRERGGEYGATTGRPRRCGWFDAVAAKYSVMLNGARDAVLTKLDVLDELETIGICVAYETDEGRSDQFPAALPVLEKCRPVVEEVEGWREDISGVRDFASLPDKAKRYIDLLSNHVGLNFTMVSVGPDREQTIRL